MRHDLVRRTVVGATILALTGTAGCFGTATGGGSGSEAGQEPTVVFSGLQDPAPLPVLVMQEKGLDTKHGFNAEFLKTDPDSSTSTFLIGKSDIAVDQNAVSAALMRNEGHDVASFYPALNSTASIVVPEKSPYHDPSDLIGEKVGHFGINSGTTQSIALTLRQFYGVNPQQDYQLSKVGPPALPQLLAGGEVEAIFDFEPFPLRAIRITPGRYLMRVADVWQKHWNWAPPVAMLTAKTSWLREHPDLARNVVAAWKDATKLIAESDYKIFKKSPYKSFLNLKNEKEMNALIEYCQDLPCYTQEWNQEDLHKQRRYMELMTKHQSILKQMPENPSVVLLDQFLSGQG